MGPRVRRSLPIHTRPAISFMTKRAQKRLIIGLVTLLLVGGAVSRFPTIGAALILHPPHRRVTAEPPPQCHEVTFNGDGVDLQGWRGDASGKHRGTLIYLHGVADNRASGAGVISTVSKAWLRRGCLRQSGARRVRWRGLHLRLLRERGSSEGAGHRSSRSRRACRQFAGSGSGSSTGGN